MLPASPAAGCISARLFVRIADVPLKIRKPVNCDAALLVVCTFAKISTFELVADGVIVAARFVVAYVALVLLAEVVVLA